MHDICIGSVIITSSLIIGFRGNVIVNVMQELVVLTLQTRSSFFIHLSYWYKSGVIHFN